MEEDAPITKPPDPTIILYDETTLKTTTTETVTTKATIALRKKTVKTRECFTFQGVSCVFPFKYAGSWHHRYSVSHKFTELFIRPAQKSSLGSIMLIG